MDQATLQRARGGDEQAFRELTDPHRRELQVHCYRMLGSLTDAEDMLQETLLAAWRGLSGFQQRASLRSWLYRIATNQCLNALRSAGRRIPAEPVPPFHPPEPTRRDEITWLQPYPDTLLEAIADTAPGPDARYQSTEAVELAFIAALQRMPPRQTAVLLLRDVLGFATDEVAGMLNTSQTAIKGTLQRARATLDQPPGAADRGRTPRNPFALPSGGLGRVAGWVMGAYGLTDHQTTELRRWALAWADDILSRLAADASTLYEPVIATNWDTYLDIGSPQPHGPRSRYRSRWARGRGPVPTRSRPRSGRQQASSPPART